MSDRVPLDLAAEFLDWQLDEADDEPRLTSLPKVVRWLNEHGYRVVKLSPDGIDTGPSYTFVETFIVGEL